MQPPSVGGRSGRAALFAALVLMGATSVRGQTEEQLAGARALATQGAEAYRAEDWERAVDLFERAESVLHAPTHLLYLARAHEKLGHLVQAREVYNKIVREELGPDAPDAFVRAQAQAEVELAAVEPRVPRLVVEVVGAAPGASVSVTVDGEPLAPALWGIAYPVNPGEHALSASGPGWLTATARVTSAEGAEGRVVLELSPDPSWAPPEAEVARRGAAEPVDDRSSGAGLRATGWAAVGVAAVGAGVGSFFVAESVARRGDADELAAACGQSGDVCRSQSTQDAIDAADGDARSAQTAAVVSYAVAGALAATGVTLLVVGRRRPASAADTTASTPAPRAAVWVSPGGVGLRGVF